MALQASEANCVNCNEVYVKTIHNRLLCDECRAKNLSASIKITCKGCGMIFPKPRRGWSNDNNAYCSRTCPGLSGTGWVDWYFHSCPTCSIRFIGAKHRKYCCQTCADTNPAVLKLAREKAREIELLNYTRNQKPIKCRGCLKYFKVSYGDKRRFFCSVKCGGVFNWGVEKAKIKLAGDVSIEHFSPFEIFRRDGYKCYLCGVRTPRRFRGTTNPLAPEIDHIVPLSKNGPHTKANVSTACRACNCAKGDTELSLYLKRTLDADYSIKPTIGQSSNTLF